MEIFKLRKQLDRVTKRKDSITKTEILNNTIMEARDIAFKIGEESQMLYQNKEITDEDYHKLLLAINNLIEYLNKKYVHHSTIEEEVD